MLKTEEVQNDRLLHLKGKNCPLYKDLVDMVKKSLESTRINEFRLFLLAGLTEYYDPSLVSESGDEIAESPMLEILESQTDWSVVPRHLEKSELRSFLAHGPKMCSYIDWAIRASKPLTVEKKMQDRCRTVIDLKLYDKMLAHESLTVLPALVLTTHLLYHFA